MAELQALQGALRWLKGGGARQDGSNPSTIVIVPDSEYAMGVIRGWTTPQQNKEYVAQVRGDYVELQEAWPDTEFLWSWQKSHTKDPSRKGKGNAQADKLAEKGMRMAVPQPRTASTPRRTPPFAPNTRPSSRGTDNRPDQRPQSQPSDQGETATKPHPQHAPAHRVSVGHPRDLSQGSNCPATPPTNEKGAPRGRNGESTLEERVKERSRQDSPRRSDGAGVSSSIVDFLLDLSPLPA